jgi:hypothetical protein
VRVHRPAAHAVAIAPHFGEQLPPGDDPAAPRHQRAEQVELLGPQRERPAGPARLALGGGELEVGEAEHLRRRAPALGLPAGGARVGPHPLQRGAETLLLERLHQVVDRAHVEGLAGVALVGGDEDDGRARLRLPGEPFGHGEPAHLRHLDVEEHHLGAICRDRVARGGAVGALGDEMKIGLAGEQPADPGPRQRLVVHDHRPDRGGHAGAAAGRSGMESAQTTPPSSPGDSSMCCAVPYSWRSRARVTPSPTPSRSGRPEGRPTPSSRTVR